MKRKTVFSGISLLILAALAAVLIFRRGRDHHADDVIVLRAAGVPDQVLGENPDSKSTLAILDEFQRQNPGIKPVPTTGLQFGGGRTMDVVPLMQIAGDIAPHVLYVNFRQSDTYIQNKFLYPLDEYVETLAGTAVADGHLLDNDRYVANLKQGARYAEEFEDRVPRQTWEVMRRECPYGEECDYLRQRNIDPPKQHVHTWCFPQSVSNIMLVYRKDLFYEAGLDEERAPQTMDEFLAAARKLTNPKQDRYGVSVNMDNLGWSTLGFLYSEGGRVVERKPDGGWTCVFNDQSAVDAYHFVARLFNESYDSPQGRQTGVMYVADTSKRSQFKIAMEFAYLDDNFFVTHDPGLYGFGPMPASKSGQRGQEFNAKMHGIYAGLADDSQQAVREAAWKYIAFYGGRQARRIRARTFVEEGYGRFVEKKLLEELGYAEYIPQIPPGTEEARADAAKYGIPEPYGRNCQQVYRFVNMAVDQIKNDDTVTKAIVAGDEKTAKARIQEILNDRVLRSNEKMLNQLTPSQMRIRSTVATVVAVSILIIFVFVFRYVFRLFARQTVRSVAGPRGNNWQFMRHAWAYLLLLPAVGSIALWEYYPLARGTVMAFQDYNVRGFSRFVGMENFAMVLFDAEFWHSMLVSLKYSALFMTFGFCAPIILAFLLTEVPRGKLIYRTIYYLPAVLSGVVVIFLWKGFYGRYGMINQVLNWFVSAINWVIGLFGWGDPLAPFQKEWLTDPGVALLFCLLPVIWAGMGPGCLIYLAALKTVPEDLYEAADIDGAGLWHKLFHIAVPSIKSLIMINFVGVMIGTIKGGSTMVLAMTGGGPYAPYGSTEVIGLHIFWQAYGYLRFGAATAMAWVLGAMLIGFTVIQLTRLSKMEFKRAGA